MLQVVATATIAAYVVARRARPVHPRRPGPAGLPADGRRGGAGRRCWRSSLDLLVAGIQRLVVSPGVTGRFRTAGTRPAAGPDRPRPRKGPWSRPLRQCTVPARTRPYRSTGDTRHETDQSHPGQRRYGRGTGPHRLRRWWRQPAQQRRLRRPRRADTIVVGSANFPESALLAEIYAEALKAKGVKVSTKLNIGSRETYIPGLQDGSIDLIPEYTGVLLQYFDKTATAGHAPTTCSRRCKTAVPATLTVLDQSAAEDKDAVIVTKDTADKYNLKSIADLQPVAGQLTLGGPPEWKTRPDRRARPQGEVRRDVQGVQVARRRRPADRSTALKNGRSRPATCSPPTPTSSPTAGSCWRTRRTCSPRRTCCR